MASNEPYWDGDVEPCLKGRNFTNGAYFGIDRVPAEALVRRLVELRLAMLDS